MSRATNQAPNPDANAPEKSYFEQQRALLLRDIGESLEQVLQNLNKLNRSLEGVTAVGNEFSAVEALWSHFENIMAKQPDQPESDKQHTGQSGQDSPSQTPSNAQR